MRKKLVAGNWKSHLNKSEAERLFHGILSGLQNHSDEAVDVAIFPPMLFVESCAMAGGAKIFVGAQNCSATNEGAFTGEVTASMIQSVGAKMILAGHSERRQLFGESDEVVKAKTDRILAAQLTPVFCCGETLDQRNSNRQNEVVLQQLQNGIFHLSEHDFNQVIIAYEPVWAIGTGVNASPQQAQEMHAFIRSAVNSRYNATTADAIRILYGGSVKPDNAHELFSCADVDGGLVGGASLKANDFISIVNAAK